MMNSLFVFIFYPLITVCWNAKAPLQDTLFAPQYAPGYLSVESLGKQAVWYSSCKDPDLKLMILKDLSSANNKKTLHVLFQLLLKESDPACQADLLKISCEYLRKDKQKNQVPAWTSKYVASQNSSVRGYACALMILSGQAKKDVFASLKKETESFPAEAAFNALKENPAYFTEPELQELIPSKNNTLRINALEALAAKSANMPDVSDPKMSIAERTAIVRGIAANPAGKIVLLIKAGSSEETLIRLAAADCNAKDPVIRGMLLKLAKDKVPMVRCAAAASLKNYPDPNARKILASLLVDKDYEVRLAAGRSLAAAKEKTLTADILAAAGKPDSFAAVLPVLEASNNPDYAKYAVSILNKTTDDKIKVAALKTLQSLSPAPFLKQILPYEKSKCAAVKAETAVVLGLIRVPESEAALCRLSADPSENTAMQALISMAKIGNKNAFKQSVITAILNTRLSPEARGEACRTAVKLGMKGKKLEKQLLRLVMTQFIPIPMAKPEYDSPRARACGLYALYLLKKNGSETAAASLSDSLTGLNAKRKNAEGTEICPEELEEFVRQIKLIDAGKEVSPAPYPTSENQTAVQAYKK